MKNIKYYLSKFIPRIYNCPQVIVIMWLNNEIIIRKELL